MTMPIPITIITGFLGAGKTTLLNRLLRAEHGLRLAVLVNDFGAVNIDAQLIVGIDIQGETISLKNGCICCTIRDDLRDAVLRSLAREDAPDAIVIETSGVSDPYAVATTFTQSAELRERTQVDCIVALVDTEQVTDLGGELFGLAVDQVSAADLVVLNKMDLVSEAQRENARGWVMGFAPNARVLEVVQADVPLALLLSAGRFDPLRLPSRPAREVHVHGVNDTPDHEHDHSLVFSTWHYTSNERLSMGAVKAAVQRLPNTIYRAKGIFHACEDESRQALLHVVGKRGTLSLGEAWGERSKESHIVVIGEQGGVDGELLTQLFDGCRASRAPATTTDVFDETMSVYRSMLRSLVE